jgi:tripartite-type tricarboxylate transporter receptor subunit TctC
MRMPTAVIAFALALASIAGASADTYPSRPITVVVPFPAGGPTDTIARILADHMKDTVGQPLLVENVTGAGATIGLGRVVAAAPDGYTVIIGNWTSFVGSPAIYPVSWHPQNDFEPIAKLPVSSLMIVGKTGLPANNAKELIAWLKANPGRPRPPVSAPAPARTSAASTSWTRPEPISSSRSIAAELRQCRISSATRSI